MAEELDLVIKARPDKQSLAETSKLIDKTFSDIDVDVSVDSAKVEGAAKRIASIMKKYAKTSGNAFGETFLEQFPGAATLSGKNQARLQALMENAPGKNAYYSKMPDPTGGFHPTQINRAGGLISHSNLVATAAAAEAAKMGVSKKDQKDIVTAALIHNRFRYLDSGKINPNVISDATTWANVYGLSGAANVLSGGNPAYLDILSKVDAVASLRSRTSDMIMGSDSFVWKDPSNLLESAVSAGEGRWKDPDMAHTADNFELVKDGMDEITDASDDETEKLQEWRDQLKNVAADLSMLAYLVKKIGTVAVDFTKSSINEASSASKNFNDLAYFANLSAKDMWFNELAGEKIGIGKNAVTDAVIDFASRRGQFKTTGEGLDLFSMTFTRAIDEAINSTDPNESYWKLAQEVLDKVKGADPTTRQQLLALVPKYLGNTGAQLVGYAAAKGITDINDLRSSQYKVGDKAGDIYSNLESQNEDLVDVEKAINAQLAWWKSVWNEFVSLPVLKLLESWLSKATEVGEGAKGKIDEYHRTMTSAVVTGAYWNDIRFRAAENYDYMIQTPYTEDVIKKSETLYKLNAIKFNTATKAEYADLGKAYVAGRWNQSGYAQFENYLKGEANKNAWFTNLTSGKTYSGAELSEAGQQASKYFKEHLSKWQNEAFTDNYLSADEQMVRDYIVTYFMKGENMKLDSAEQKAYYAGFADFFDILTKDFAQNPGAFVPTALDELHLTVSTDTGEFTKDIIQNKTTSAGSDRDTGNRPGR